MKALARSSVPVVFAPAFLAITFAFTAQAHSQTEPVAPRPVPATDEMKAIQATAISPGQFSQLMKSVQASAESPAAVAPHPTKEIGGEVLAPDTTPSPASDEQ